MNREIPEMITPATEPFDLTLPSAQYEVFVNGKRLPVHQARVSAAPINQVWPGYQRPISQTEIASFAHWDMPAKALVRVVCAKPFVSVRVRPLSLDITPLAKDGVIEFTLDNPKPVTVECDGRHGALHLFPNPPERHGASETDENTRMFGPGVHHPGKMTLKSGETIYIAEGAIVYGCVEAKHQKNIRILGRGVLDGSKVERFGAPGLISLYKCEDVLIDGIILRDPSSWTVIPANCKRVVIDNVKLIGLWRYNADGIDVVNSEDVIIRNSFLRTFDDSIVLKGLKGWGGDATDSPESTGALRHVRSEGCVIWCDWGRALELGAETCADTFDDIVFSDIDIIFTTHIALDVQHGDRAKISDVAFEDIRVEMDGYNPPPMLQTAPYEFYAHTGEAFLPILFYTGIARTMWSKDEICGSVNGVTVKNLSVVTDRHTPESVIFGADADHAVKGVTFENITVNGGKVSNAGDMNLKIGDHVSGVKFI